MKRIGVISDTHGTFDDTLKLFLKDVDEIWHAGDIGNIDNSSVRYHYGEFAYFKCEEVTVLMTHIGGYPRHYQPKALQKIQSCRPTIFIAGHSHILKVIYDKVYDTLHINPGAAGCYGFHNVRTAIRFTIDGSNIRDMEIGNWERDKRTAW